MPRYFFHMSDGFHDAEGLDVEDQHQLRALAMRTAAEVLGDNPHLWNGNSWRMKVTDVDGELALHLELVATVTASDSDLTELPDDFHPSRWLTRQAPQARAARLPQAGSGLSCRRGMSSRSSCELSVNSSSPNPGKISRFPRRAVAYGCGHSIFGKQPAAECRLLTGRVSKYVRKRPDARKSGFWVAIPLEWRKLDTSEARYWRTPPCWLSSILIDSRISPLTN